jgi:putative methyltransferase (TIGR04325 family)
MRARAEVELQQSTGWAWGERSSDAAAVALFVFNRPEHTLRTVESLKRNQGALATDLFVFSDSSRLDSQAGLVQQVRTYLRSIDGFRSVMIIERDRNWGLADSIMDGVSTVVNARGSVIVLEDDMLTSPHFLTYMNEALEKYRNDERVVSVHGYVYPVESALPETFFLRGADCWGWATWKRGWELFNPNGQYLLEELKRRNLLREFDFNGSYPFARMLQRQIQGKNDSWAVRWYASAFLADKLTLYPGRSLVHNIGNDDSGTHSGASARMDNVLSHTPISLRNIEVQPSQQGLQAFVQFFQRSQSIRRRVLGKVISPSLKTALRGLARNWLPPVVERRVRGLVVGGSFEGDFATWDQACAHCTGYDDTRILAKVLDATLRVKCGVAAFERDSVLFDKVEYAWPMLAGLMSAAARDGGRLNVLDFGGALGSSYFQNLAFLQTLPEVQWNVVEQEHYVDVGRAHIEHGPLHFYRTINECLSETHPNVVLLSSVLQYLQSPTEVLQRLSESGASCLIIDRTPFAAAGRGRLLIQRVPPRIYSASYPMWVFSHAEIMQILNPGWRLLASNVSPEGAVISKEGLEFTFRGLLLEARR